MKANLIKTALFGAVATAFSLASCSKNDGPDTTIPEDVDRWITVSGAMMDEEAGDGNGGTMVYSVSAAQAKDPGVSINVFDNGMHVKSQRTARLQASADGDFLYNIQYVGDDGGIFNKYSVHGGKDFRPDGPEVETATYVSTSPRWLKAAEGVGVAVRAAANDAVYEGTNPNFVFKYRRAKTDAITLDLNDPKITKTTSFELGLSEDEEAAGYYVSRIDVPVINKAGNKVFIGAAVNKVNPDSYTLEEGVPVFDNDRTRPKSWAKTLVLDYPSLANPKVITSTQTRGNTNGYRSTMQYVGTDGHVYQATSGEAVGTGGSKILRISTETNDYDNSYVFSLDQALGLTNTYIETWRYTGDGIGFVVYSLVNNAGERTGGYIARVDLNNKTATKYTIPNEAALKFRQIQNIAIDGDDVYIAVAAIGQNGNIYVFDRKTGEMTVGAKLVNKTGNQYIGVY
ncbi:hypothetical protein [Parapedobacter tibetensis]|uniref:hypothetical protein n=1 Tax=Parapedobacter tibetensis TaxID=2972951 RepID=UPI00214D79B9|nr:hypothetical protein [Parapedobacter tibetensis]